MPSLPETDGIRLQKVLAAAGLGSRRACEAMIADGRVEIDGDIVTDQGVRVDPATVIIRVDGERIPTAPDMVTLAFNKPRGVVSTMADEQGRPCISDFLDARRERLFHVGRLDTDTSGLLLLTNDGNLAQRLMHPSFEMPKTYVATVKGEVTRDVVRTLKSGVELDDGPAKFDRARIVGKAAGRTMLEVELHEGRNRIVRRIFDAVDHPVLELVRTRIGPVHIGQQRPGTLRALDGRVLGTLYASVEL
jgi:23S rRNA pseudouridine2605 synthase